MDKSIRLTNYIIDILMVTFISIGFVLIIDALDAFRVSFYAIMFLYYLSFEAYNGQTIGKRITNTKVVNKDGTKPSFVAIIFRSFLRLIPIDPLSYLFGSEQGFHDKIASTRLVKK